MKNSSRTILVTSALPYANGSIHLGHMVETIQADIWVRLQKLRGHKVSYVCADDAHGTPVMLKAQQENITPEELIATLKQEHQQDFADFNVHFDNYHTTHSPENQELASLFFQRLQANGDIETRTISQAFDPVKEMFLPDRFVKGECPNCGSPDQNGDNCDACGATYSPLDLVNPRSVLSDANPIAKESEHYFFKLSKYQTFLKQWIRAEHVHEHVANKLAEWLHDDLQAWDISRDAPYFGFEIPGAPNKYFYVWLDAPMGYIASFKNLCDSDSSLDFDAYWKPDSETELYHFLGKDILYFHALFWPAMLQGAGFRTPTELFIHGFLTVNGQKMSKSRGTFINARDYLNKLDPAYLRYYLASKLGPNIDDIDFNFEDFKQRVNSDLVGKVVNIASRCAGFIQKKFEGMLASELSEPKLFEEFTKLSETIADLYEQREYAKATRKIMELADIANQYIAERQPWVLAKQAGQEQQVQAICTMGINLFRMLIIYLKPVLPMLAERSENFLNILPLIWADSQQPLLDHRINQFKPLLQRVEAVDL